MVNKHRFIVLVPVFNEEKNIEKTILSIPNSIHKIIIINDGSNDNSSNIIQQLAKNNSKIVNINHEKNMGKGAAIISGFNEYMQFYNSKDMICLLDGDGQINPLQLNLAINYLQDTPLPILKGSRFINDNNQSNLPFFRKIGNHILKWLNRISSGYWNITDPQNGFLIIQAKILKSINFAKLDHTLYVENSFLHSLKRKRTPIKEFPITVKYNIGEISSINYLEYIPKTAFKLLYHWLNRIYTTYGQSKYRLMSALSHFLIILQLLYSFYQDLTILFPLTILIYSISDIYDDKQIHKSQHKYK